MSENEEFETSREEKRHTSTPNPALEGEGGQYMDGDYGDAGAVDEPAVSPAPGAYPEGDYGDAGVADEAVTGGGKGAYVEGDYGDAGVPEPATAVEGEYEEGDYGDAGKVDPSGLTQRQRNATGDDVVPGRADDDTEGRVQRD
ncbi:hypothetical protein ACW0JT_05865 [Arthrobacter sp. SA17]